MRRGLVIGGGVLLVGVVAVLIWAVGGDDERPADVLEAEDDVRFPDVDPYGFFQEEDEEPDVEAPASEMSGMMRFGREDWSRLTPEERRAKRLAMREEWLQMTPEERAARRAQRAARRVSITATGEGEPHIDPTDVMGSVREVRPQIRECVNDNGGWQALREAAAAASPDGGAGRGMSLAFDLSAEGQVGALDIQPPPPERFANCFQSAFSSLEMPAPGAEARVEIRLGGGGRRANVTGQMRAGDPPR